MSSKVVYSKWKSTGMGLTLLVVVVLLGLFDVCKSISYRISYLT
jgi:hypothetical protein